MSSFLLSTGKVGLRRLAPDWPGNGALPLLMTGVRIEMPVFFRLTPEMGGFCWRSLWFAFDLLTGPVPGVWLFEMPGSVGVGKYSF